MLLISGCYICQQLYLSAFVRLNTIKQLQAKKIYIKKAFLKYAICMFFLAKQSVIRFQLAIIAIFSQNNSIWLKRNMS